jgi:hypothetical protein
MSLQALIGIMVSRTYGRGRPLNAPAAFIHPCQPIVAKQNGRTRRPAALWAVRVLEGRG